MHSSKDAACTWSPRQQSQRANHFSFPPTQRFGLLGSTPTSKRSSNQRKNLERSYHKLLDALNVPALQHAIA